MLALSGVLASRELAPAVEFSVIGPASITVEQGQAFSIDLSLTNDSATSLAGLDVELSGMAGAGAVVTSGQTAAAHFVQNCSATERLGGVNTARNNFFDPDGLSNNQTFRRADSGRAARKARSSAPSRLESVNEFASFSLS